MPQCAFCSFLHLCDEPDSWGLGPRLKEELANASLCLARPGKICDALEQAWW